MTLKTDSNGQIQRRKKDDGLRALVNTMLPEIKRALPKHCNPEKMARIFTTALRTTRNLADCTPTSFLACLMTASQLGLEPNTPMGYCYLIPRRSKGGGYECSLMLGYQGMLRLARQSGLIASIYAFAVREGDDFSYELGLSPTLRHVPSNDSDRSDKQITHTYAVCRMKDGSDPVFCVLSLAEIEKRRSRSASANSGRVSPWDTDYEAMALKSAVRALYTWIPKSTEFEMLSRALEMDEMQDRGSSIVQSLSEESSALLLSSGMGSDDDVQFEMEEEKKNDEAL